MTCPQCEQLRAALRWLRERSRYDDSATTGARYVEALCADCATSPLQSVITWIPVSERLPEGLEAGDRILLVLNERQHGGNLRLAAITLEATEDGWHSPDTTYAGYTPEDGEYWIKEADLLPPPPESEEETG